MRFQFSDTQRPYSMTPLKPVFRRNTLETINNMSDNDDFNVPGINLLDPWLINELKKVDPRSPFLWTTKEKQFISERFVSRGESIKLQILKKLHFH